jgi:hypothetical protein
MRGLDILARYRAKALTARPSFTTVNSHWLLTPPVQVFFPQNNKPITRIGKLFWCERSDFH